MQPLGTITKYYPFIDKESKTILDSLMEDSGSYYDFVQRLCEVVLEKEVPVHLAYIAAVQAWWSRIDVALTPGVGLMSQIQEKYKETSQIRPWGYIHTTIEGDQIRSHDNVVKAIENLMKSSPDDWVLAELHLLHAHFHWPIFGDIPSLLEPVEKARELIAANPLLDCFEALAFYYEGWAKRIEGKIEDALAIYQKGLELAEAHDDSLQKYLFLGGQGDALKNVSIKEAIARFEEAYNVVQDLGVPYLEAEVLHDSALVFETAGDYDLALSSLIESGRALGAEFGGGTNATQISRIYAILGNGQKALELANIYAESVGDVPTLAKYFNKTYALALLNRLDDAEKNLTEVHKLAISSGLDRVLGRYYLLAGFVELQKDDYFSAMDFYEKAWELFHRVGEVRGEKNQALLGLAKAEILITKHTTGFEKTVTPGRWLCELEDYATERDLSGIRMQAAQLKSEFYAMHDQLKDAQAVLVDALKITDSKGVATLRKRIIDRIQEIEGLIEKKEVVR